MAAAMGLAFGMGPCLLVCFPYLGPVFLGLPDGTRASWRVLLPHSLGRICAYTAYGATAGQVGGWAGQAMGAETIRAVTGLAALAVGIALLLRAPSCRCRPMERHTLSDGVLPGGLFLMGAAMTLTPCGPLSAVMVAAAAGGSAIWGGMLGVSFGLGATLIPALVFGVGLAHLSQRLRARLGEWRRPVEAASALLLIACGVSGLWAQ
jgi:uncharacterized protein